MRVFHEFPPYYNSDSEILILGSMPSVVSRKEGFYYMHPSNRFWRVLELVYGEKIIDKKSFLKAKKIALWDVISACDIVGSSDSSIKNVVVNDINSLVRDTHIKKIFTVGKKSDELYQKYLAYKVNINWINLPSTSSANARYSLDDLVREFNVLLDD